LDEGTLARALLMETKIGYEYAQQVRAGHAPPPARGETPVYPDWVQLPVLRMLMDFDVANFVRLSNEYIALLARPHFEVKGAVDAWSEEVDALPAYNFLGNRLLPALGRVSVIDARKRAYYDLSYIGTLVEQYQETHGVPPESLEVFDARSEKKLPKDPHTGESYRYLLGPGDFRLYSVGMNLIDDIARHDPRDGDIVWRGYEDE
jgi:hypothetical protein